MKKHPKKRKQVMAQEQGMAMILAMMCLLLCTSLGVVMVFNSAGEATLAGGFSRNEQAFYAADAGIGIARQALRKTLNDAIKSAASSLTSSPTLGTRNVATTAGTKTLATYNPTPLASVLQSSSMIASTGAAITNAKAAIAARSTALSNAGFEVDIALTLESVSTPTTIDIDEIKTLSGVDTVVPKAEAIASVTGRYRYTLTATGNNGIAEGNPNRAIAKAVETGVIGVTLNMNIEKKSSGGSSTRSFSQYGTFWNRFPAGAVVASGSMGGKVHTNEGWSFSGSNSVTFMGEVTQVNPKYTWNGAGYNVSSVAPNSTPKTGVTFNSSFKQVSTLPLPTNSFGQELAIINATGRADLDYPPPNLLAPEEGPKPTTDQLVAKLRKFDGTPPSTTGGATPVLSDGVYVPVNSTTNKIFGGGIYVKGNVDEMTLSYSGSSQIYAIKQAGTTTTVTITPPSGSSSGTTVISRGGTNTSYPGVPMDLTSPITADQHPACGVYVDGNINNLHGPAKSGTVVPEAISKNTRLSITSTGDITITGNLTYQEPATDMSGKPVTYTDGHTPINVLGLYTNAGKILLNPNSAYTGANYSMTIDAAMVAFNEVALMADASQSTGGVQLNSANFNSSTVITLRGSRTQSKGIPYTGKGEKYNRFFDTRFENGNLAPPFFPATKITNTITSVTRTFTTETTAVHTESNTWQRTYN